MREPSLFDGRSPSNVPKLVEGFLSSLTSEKSASEHTIINYDIDLRHFLKYLFDHHAPFTFQKVCNLKIIRGFVSDEMQKYSRATVGRRLSVIKGFLKYLHREGYIEKNVAKLISLPKQEERLPHILKPVEAIQLIEGIPSNTIPEKRMKAIVELLYSTGIRVSELAGLTYEKLNFTQSTILVFGKGSKERLVPMGEHCRKALLDYIDAVPRLQKTGASTPLFLNHEGKALSVRSIQRLIRKFAQEILGTKGDSVTPHTFRHSCATHLLAGGAGLREIQELLGHRSLVTTQKYTQVDIQRLKESYKKAHPKEQGPQPKRRIKEL